MAVKPSEKQWSEQVVDLAHLYGWRVCTSRAVAVRRPNGSVYHETPYGADGKGFPDLVLVRDRVVFAELKLDRDSKVYPEQVAWGQALTAAGAEVYLWRPRDLDDIKVVLKR